MAVQNSETRKWVTYPRVSVMEEEVSGGGASKERDEEDVTSTKSCWTRSL